MREEVQIQKHKSKSSLVVGTCRKFYASHGGWSWGVMDTFHHARIKSNIETTPSLCLSIAIYDPFASNLGPEAALEGGR